MKDIDAEIPIERYEEIDSTTSAARRAVESGELGDHARLFVAARQTAGRGRHGRSWESPEGGLWCTLAWPIELDPARVLDGLGLRVGMASVHAIEHTLAAHGHGEDVTLKWPNDIYVGGRKVAGVLCEIIKPDGKTYALIGVGVNGNFSTTELSEDIRQHASTLSDILGRPVNLDRLLEDLRRRLRDATMTEGVCSGLMNDVRAHLHGVGDGVVVTFPNKQTHRGRLLGINDDGRIRIDTVEGEVVVPFGAEMA